jgi:hypothetical protein
VRRDVVVENQVLLADQKVDRDPIFLFLENGTVKLILDRSVWSVVNVGERNGQY